MTEYEAEMFMRVKMSVYIVMLKNLMMTDIHESVTCFGEVNGDDGAHG